MRLGGRYMIGKTLAKRYGEALRKKREESVRARGTERRVNGKRDDRMRGLFVSVRKLKAVLSANPQWTRR